ncbi:VOC family protein [Bailinhaonella thermotolerans]|uniref:VOC family protein n=2 Tax=Bailinhaonella thermotolerans TaxID=1070861 RepID=A0A3A4B0F9_9ACTN|nr:VOC family protein [Bailinhaonella thermotolerans]
MVSLDCGDPAALARFYAQVLGWEVTHSQDEYAMITSPDGVSLGFGRVEDYQPPRWPDPSSPKRFHLDFYVDDLDKAQERCVELGASVAEFQPGGDRWRVLLDPAGHPFDICLKS